MLQSSSRVSNAVATMLNVGPCSERCQNGEKQAGVTSVQDPGLGGRASVECRLTKALRNKDCDIEGTKITKIRIQNNPPPQCPPPLHLSSSSNVYSQSVGDIAVRLALFLHRKASTLPQPSPARHPYVASQLPSLAEPSLGVRLSLLLTPELMPTRPRQNCGRGGSSIQQKQK